MLFRSYYEETFVPIPPVEPPFFNHELAQSIRLSQSQKSTESIIEPDNLKVQPDPYFEQLLYQSTFAQPLPLQYVPDQNVQPVPNQPVPDNTPKHETPDKRRSSRDRIPRQLYDANSGRYYVLATSHSDNRPPSQDRSRNSDNRRNNSYNDRQRSDSNNSQIGRAHV